MIAPRHRWQLAPDPDGLDALDYNNCLAEVTAGLAEIETDGALDTYSDVIRLLQDDQTKGIGWDDAQVALDRGRVEFGWPTLRLVPAFDLNANWTRALALLDEGRAMGLVIQSGLAPASCVPRSVAHAVLVLRRIDAYTALVDDPYCRTGPSRWALADLRRAAEAIVGVGKTLSAVFTSPKEASVAVVVLTPLVPSRTFRVPATARGFRPDSPTPVKTAQFASAHADATAIITQTPASLVPHGSFVRAFDGPLAGLYIPAGEVTLDPAPPAGDCAAAARQAWNDARQAAANAAGPALLTAVPAK